MGAKPKARVALVAAVCLHSVLTDSTKIVVVPPLCIISVVVWIVLVLAILTNIVNLF